MSPNESEVNEELYEKGRLYAKRMKSGLVYGPITSRRSKISLGINPVKGGFLCNFDCIYCQYGKEANQRGKFSTPPEIKKALEKRIKKIIKNREKINSLTICGPTEPLLNPKIKEIIDIVIKLRNKYLPRTEIDLFTNASRQIDFSGIDRVFLKFDADFSRVEKPKDKTTKTKVIQNIVNANSNPKIIQSMWFKGKSGNLHEKSIDGYIRNIKRINESSPINLIQIYTVLYLPMTKGIAPCNEKELKKLSDRIVRETNVRTQVFYRPPKIDKKIVF